MVTREGSSRPWAENEQRHRGKKGRSAWRDLARGELDRWAEARSRGATSSTYILQVTGRARELGHRVAQRESKTNPEVPNQWGWG